MVITWMGVTAAILLLFSCYIGYQRGLIKEVVSLLCVILAIVIVWFVNPYVNQFIRENTGIYETMQEKCAGFAEEKVGDFEDITAETQKSIIEGMHLPSLLSEQMLKNNTAEGYQNLSVTTFTDYIAGYLADIAVSGISFLISFLLATLLIRSITWAVDLIAKLPVLKGMNKLAGGLLGAVKYLIVVWLFFLILTIACNTTVGEIGLQTIREDTFLSYLYDKDIFILVFMNIFS